MISDVMTRVEETEEPGQPGRRGFLKRASGIGAAVVGWLAVTWADSPSAFAAPGCCDLRYPNGPWCGGTKGRDGSGWSCPSGYTKRYWSCHTAHFYYTCWECTKGSTCWSGPWKCSNYFVVYVPS
ncbi:MAG TPA: twin-arginine translocation signal domain-containing protein [Streptosporangiaceae bacterium]|jgi:hypothetical protein